MSSLIKIFHDSQGKQFSLEIVAELARADLLSDSELPNMVLVEGSLRNIGLLLEIPPVLEDRYKQMFEAALALAQMKRVGMLKQVFLISQIGTDRKEDVKSKRSGLSRDNQGETLLTCSLDCRQNQEETMLFEIIRNEEGNVITVERIQLDQGGTRHTNSLLTAFASGYEVGINDKIH